MSCTEINKRTIFCSKRHSDTEANSTSHCKLQPLLARTKDGVSCTAFIQPY